MDKANKNINKQKENKKNSYQTDLFSIKQPILPKDKRIFIPSWSNEPPFIEPIITFNDIPILTLGNLTLICAGSGVGKSALMEVIASSWLMIKQFDTIGFRTKLPYEKDKILYIDSERSTRQNWISWKRTLTRAGINKPDVDERLIYINVRKYPILDRKDFINAFLNDNNDIRLILIDSIGDYLIDKNSIHDTIAIIDWLNSFNPYISVVLTLHTNPTNPKPTGHLGSYLLNKVDACLLIRKTLDKQGTREITTDFEFGKVREGKDTGNSKFMVFDDKYEMFLSTEYIPPTEGEQEQIQKQKDIDLVASLFNGMEKLKRDTLESKFIKLTGTTKNNFDYKMKDLSKKNLIISNKKHSGIWYKNIA